MTVLYHDSSRLSVGGVMRYKITALEQTKSLFCRVRNTELSALRAAYLNGPYNLYVDMRLEEYNEFEKIPKQAEPKYNYHVHPGSHFSFELPILHKHQTWIITVHSEIMFSRSAEINFEVTIGDSEGASKLHGKKASSALVPNQLEVVKQDTAKIWQSPLPKQDQPLHVAVLTHGLVSHVTGDLLYLKEAIDKAALLSGENIVCKGYTGNVCRTSRGIKYLGRRLAHWIVDELIPTYRPQKLSFLGHSLGGPTQTYALGYIQSKFPHVLEGIELVNFITFASPMLGVSTENPGYVQFALDFGVVGRTGRDLALSWTPSKKPPLLARLPSEPTLKVLRRFKHRTLYANAVHDGIVPLRTSALVFLDWYAIAEANMAYKTGKHHYHTQHSTSTEDALETRRKQHDEEEVEEEEEEEEDTPSSTGSSSRNNTLKSFLFERKQAKIFSHYQTVNDLDKASDVGETLPHKTSLLENSMFILLPPHPSAKFITDPSTRENVIFHDRVYSQKDLPKKKLKTTLFSTLSGAGKVDTAKTEEKIARKYHENLSWRKVLVALRPEAHNNIVVRRRFSNAYGWPVVHHCVTEHFGMPDIEEKMAEMSLNKQDSFSSVNSMEPPWSDSDEEEVDMEHDPQSMTMLKIVQQRTNDERTK